MTTEIKGTHGYSPSETTKDYIDGKLTRLEHLKEHIADLHIIMEHENNGEYITEANIHFRWGTMGHIEVRNRKLFVALDALFDKIDKKATREKEKKQDHTH